MNRSSRPMLRAIPGYAGREADVLFCGHCGRAAAADDGPDPGARVCTRCNLGLLIGAPPELAPSPVDPFLLVDSTLSVCGVSGMAEEVLQVSETGLLAFWISRPLVGIDNKPGDFV